MKISIINTVGIEVDQQYPWKETLFLNENIASLDEKDYLKCKRFIKIKYNEQLNEEGLREVANRSYISANAFYDDEYGVKVIVNSEDTLTLEVKQECNEWLVIAIQIMLLKEDYSFIHAAAVYKNGEVLLIPSWGGVGKTACVAKLVKEEGYKLLGDDLNIIHKSGKIMGLPKDFVIYFYHKELFPEVFNENEGPKANDRLNKFYSRIIPVVKPILRRIPAVLAFARKHNPQSKRVSPIKIFGKENIVKEGMIKDVIWMERVVGSDNKFYSRNKDDIASKASSVTLLEVFAEKLQCIYMLCGCGLIRYEEVFKKTFNIYIEAFEGKNISELDITVDTNIAEVPTQLIKNIKN